MYEVWIKGKCGWSCEATSASFTTAMNYIRACCKGLHVRIVGHGVDLSWEMSQSHRGPGGRGGAVGTMYTVYAMRYDGQVHAVVDCTNARIASLRMSELRRESDVKNSGWYVRWWIAPKE
jgi:hypothetical protein